MRTPSVIVSIDELRLHGFDPRARRAIGDAVARELARRFSERPPNRRPRSVTRLDGGTFGLRQRGVKAVAIGTGIAAAVHREVSRPW